MKTLQTRMTRQRKVILEELRNLTSHPTAEEIHSLVKARLPRVSLGTIYRNLDFLSASGEVLQLNAGALTRRFDGNPVPHLHVRCLECGRVGDVTLEQNIPDIDSLKPHVHGFTVLGTRLEFEGLCEYCDNAQCPKEHVTLVDLPATA